MSCKHCDSVKHSSDQHFSLMKDIEEKGFPTAEKDYEDAHKHADILEKKKYPKGYEKLKKIDNNLPKRQLAGKNLPSGKIEVSKKVPKSLRKEVAFHERVENKYLKSKSK